MKDMIEALRARHEFEMRQGRNRAGTSLFVWRFFLAGNEIAGWHAHRIRVVPAPEGPVGMLSVWQREGGDKDELLGLDVYEADSRAAAHEFVLRLLGEFQGEPGDQTTDLGDVSFVTGSSALFARANLVVLARALGTGNPPVRQIASAFDGDLITQPKVDGPFAPTIEVFRARGAALEIVAADPQKRRIQYRLFAPGGEFSAAGNELRFVPRDTPARITLFAINADRVASRAELELDRAVRA